MWIEEISKVYCEAGGYYLPNSPNLPGDARQTYASTERIGQGLEYKGVFGAGGMPVNRGTESLAQGGIRNPSFTEQEEEQSTLLDFDKWWKMEGGQMNFPSPEIEDASKRLAYNAWAAAKNFYDFGS